MAHIGQARHLDGVDEEIAAREHVAPLGGGPHAPALAAVSDEPLGDLLRQVEPDGVDIYQRKTTFIQPLHEQDVRHELPSEYRAPRA